MLTIHYHTSQTGMALKMSAKSSEEANVWVEALELAINNLQNASKSEYGYLRDSFGYYKGMLAGYSARYFVLYRSTLYVYKNEDNLHKTEDSIMLDENTVFEGKLEASACHYQHLICHSSSSNNNNNNNNDDDDENQPNPNPRLCCLLPLSIDITPYLNHSHHILPLCRRE